MNHGGWIGLLVLALPAHAAIAGEPIVLPAVSGTQFEVALPERAIGAADATLSIDLDGYDVSAFARVDGGRVMVELDAPLDAGRYGLGVFLFGSDGSAEVLVEAVLEVPKARGIRATLDSMLQTGYRTDARPVAEFDAVDRETLDGSLKLAAEGARGHWKAALAADAIYDADNPAAPPSAWLLPKYDLSVAYANEAVQSSLAAGNVRFATEDLLLGSFKRRGATLDTRLASGRFDLRLYSVASTPRNGFDGRYLAPGADGDRSSGVAASLVLVEDRLSLRGGYLDGEAPFGGAGFNALNDEAVYGGDSWNVVVDSRWLDGSIVAGFERAGSRFDADGFGAGLPSARDDASSATLAFSSSGALGAGPFAWWTTEFRHRRVGRDYYSLGHLALPGNLEVRSGSRPGWGACRSTWTSRASGRIPTTIPPCRRRR